MMSCFYEKKIDQYEKQVLKLIALLQKSNIDIYSSTSYRSSSSSFLANGKATRKGHALCATTTLHSSKWLLDLGASRHMTSSQGLFLLLRLLVLHIFWWGQITLLWLYVENILLTLMMVHSNMYYVFCLCFLSFSLFIRLLIVGQGRQLSSHKI